MRACRGVTELQQLPSLRAGVAAERLDLVDAVDPHARPTHAAAPVPGFRRSPDSDARAGNPALRARPWTHGIPLGKLVPVPRGRYFHSPIDHARRLTPLPGIVTAFSP